MDVPEAIVTIGGSAGAGYALKAAADWLRSRGRAAEDHGKADADAVAALREELGRHDARLKGAEARLDRCEENERKCQEERQREAQNADDWQRAAMRTQTALDRANAQLAAVGVTPVGMVAVVPSDPVGGDET